MKSIPLKTITEQVKGHLVLGRDDFVINDVVLRNRYLREGAVLFDVYHDNFINTRICNTGLCAVITNRPDFYRLMCENAAVIEVMSVDDAYWSFVDYYRGLFDIPVIGVTGTCGKTTTKEMIKHILSKRFAVNATFKSYNADFRHFNYLLEINDDTEAAVYEMGVAAPGDLKRCSRYFRPKTGVITNIGVDHLAAFRTHDDYIKAKGEMIDALGFEGTLILNADNDNIKKIDLSPFKGKIYYYGYDEKSDFLISDFERTERSIRFNLKFNNEKYNAEIPVLADFNAYNAAAAIAACTTAGIDVRSACEALKSYKNVEKHFEVNKGINGSTVIDDTWSTNPTSAESALEMLKNIANGRKTVAALGKMSLLGSKGSEYHYKIGAKIAELKIDRLILLGEGAREIGIGALKAGIKPENIFMCRYFDETLSTFESQLDCNTVALVKTTMMASYSDIMERITVKP